MTTSKDKQRMIPIHKEEPAENRQRCYGFANISSIEATLLEETYIRTVGLSLATTVQHIHDPSIRFGGNRSKGELIYKLQSYNQWFQSNQSNADLRSSGIPGTVPATKA